MQRTHLLICRSNQDKTEEFLLYQKVKGRANRISLVLQKHVLSHPPLLPDRHQVHPGGARLHGLRIGIISTIGKTVSGMKNGEIRQHRLTFSMNHRLPESLTAVLKNIFYRFPTTEES